MKNILEAKNTKAKWLFVAIVMSFLMKSAQSQDYSDFFSNNGSFELGSSAPPLVFPSPNSSVNTITGWRLSAGGTYPLWLENGQSQEGDRHIRLRSSGGSSPTSSGASIDGGLISHTPFSAGEIYELSFWAAGGASPNNTLLVGIGSGIQQSFDVPDYTQVEFDALSGLAWNRYTMNFIAPFSTFTLSVTSPDSTNPAFNSTVFLDNFSIVAVPEPGSVMLMMAAGLVLGSRRKRLTLATS